MKETKKAGLLGKKIFQPDAEKAAVIQSVMGNAHTAW